jgi:hypothetical protein
VIQFHAEWNPVMLEQQIGRVDRKGNLWEKRARNWINGIAKPKAGRREAPKPAGLAGRGSTVIAVAAVREGAAKQRTPRGSAEAERVRRGTPSVAAARGSHMLDARDQVPRERRA